MVELHGVLLAGVRGRERQPGELRTTQNWIGCPGATTETATFVPPPPGRACWAAQRSGTLRPRGPTAPSARPGRTVHYQFETIHPFLDGNGRIGRLLIVIFLVVRDRLPSPLLYLSPFFEARRQAYYDALQGVRQRGELDAWLRLFLDGVQPQANRRAGSSGAAQRPPRAVSASVQATTRGGANRLVDLVLSSPSSIPGRWNGAWA
jgi:hypothetical protein